MPRADTLLDYGERIDRVLDHVRAHLRSTHRLSTLARVANFSPFHFHRVFQSVTGETLRAFVLRARVERAVFLLGRAATRRTLTEVALECGFTSSAEFSRAFRAAVGVTPSAFRAGVKLRKNPQAPRVRPAYSSGHEQRLSVQVRSSPERIVAFVRVTDPFVPGRVAQAQQRLERWLQARGLHGAGFLGISHDDPAYTPLAQCRYDVACELREDARGSSGVSVRRLPSARFATVQVRGSASEMERAWARLFEDWLPASGFEPDDGPGEERYAGAVDFDAGAVELALPVRRTRG